MTLTLDERIEGEQRRGYQALQRIIAAADTAKLVATEGDWGSLQETAAAIVQSSAQLQASAAILLALSKVKAK
jgi:hypothetical protein